MNNTLEKIKSYSVDKKNIIILLSVYNASFLLAASVFQGYLTACFVISVFISLIALYLITWVNFFKKANEEEIKSENEQEAVRKNIRDEYLKIHRVRKKNELLIKVGCMSPEKLKKNVTVDDDTPLIPSLDASKEVRLDYLKGEEIKGQPEGT